MADIHHLPPRVCVCVVRVQSQSPGGGFLVHVTLKPNALVPSGVEPVAVRDVDAALDDVANFLADWIGGSHDPDDLREVGSN